MTRTTQALKRLGVAGLAVVTIGAGVPAFFVANASAATATGVSLTPDTVTNTVGTCQAFTATVTPAPTAPDSTVVDVQISQVNPAFGTGVDPGTGSTLTFCDPDGTSAGTTPNRGTAVQNQSQAPGNTTNGSGAAATNQGTFSCTGANATTNQASLTRCEAQFTTTGGSNTVTFGVLSNRTGTVDVIAFFDSNPNRVPESFEPQDASTFTVVSNTASTLSCTPDTANAPEGGFVDFVCTATTNGAQATGANVQYIITAGPDANPGQSTFCGTAANPQLAAPSNSAGQVTCRVTNTSNNIGPDSVIFFVNQNGQSGPQTGEPQDTGTAIFTGDARNIDCEPEDQTVQSGGVATIICTVTDARGQRVAASTGTNTNAANFSDQFVTFSTTGAGRFVEFNSAQDRTAPIDSNGQARVQTTSQPNETGTQTVTGTLTDAQGRTFAGGTSQGGANNPAECTRTAGVTGTTEGVTTAPTTPGNCADSVFVRYTATGATASPSTSPTTSSSASATPTTTSTATSTATATATATTTATTTTTASATQTATAQPTTPTRQLGLTVTSPATITPGQQAILRGTGQPNAIVILRCYSRPSVEYFDARTVPLGENGEVEFRLSPGTNTRCFLKYQNTADNDARNSASVVQNVATALSLSVRRLGVRNYIFEGRILPRRAGQLITLYRVDSSGREVLTQQVRTDSTGTWRMNRVFTGSGTFNFIARTGQNLTNVAGRSNVRPTAIF